MLPYTLSVVLKMVKMMKMTCDQWCFADEGQVCALPGELPQRRVSEAF